MKNLTEIDRVNLSKILQSPDLYFLFDGQTTSAKKLGLATVYAMFNNCHPGQVVEFAISLGENFTGEDYAHCVQFIRANVNAMEDYKNENATRKLAVSAELDVLTKKNDN